MTSTDNCINTGSCQAGTLVNVQVNDSKNYNFYVIKDTGTELTLIMEKNLGNMIAWIDRNDYANSNEYGDYGNNSKGPITALNYLNSQTSTWDNIDPIVNYTYNNSSDGNTKAFGYQKFQITNGAGTLTSQNGVTIKLAKTSKARLLTYEEATALKASNNNTAPVYIYANLSASKPFGYWYLTSYESSNNQGRNVGHDGYITYYFYVYNNVDNGIRLVITIQK